MGKELDTPPPDQVVAGVASRQHGVITTEQLVDAGLLASGITKRITAGRLHRLHRGVYAVGHAGLGNEGRWMAAVLACGAGAVLSHLSAAFLWRMLSADRGTAMSELEDALVDVTVPGITGRARRQGIRLHRSRNLASEDCTCRAGIPVTKPARTLKDLRRALPGTVFATALRQAEYLRLPIGEELRPDHTRSELEGRFLALVRRHRLPQPEVNVRLGRFVVDFLWREQRLVAEVDGWAAHRARSAFEADRARDAQLTVLGYRVVRFTWSRIIEDRGNVARTLRTVLGVAG